VRLACDGISLPRHMCAVRPHIFRVLLSGASTGRRVVFTPLLCVHGAPDSLGIYEDLCQFVTHEMGAIGHVLTVIPGLPGIFPARDRRAGCMADESASRGSRLTFAIDGAWAGQAAKTGSNAMTDPMKKTRENLPTVYSSPSSLGPMLLPAVNVRLPDRTVTENHPAYSSCPIYPGRQIS
jgi:hypothetical protein